jgi:hypothetical protein
LLRDDIGGPVLFKTQFGMSMDVAPDGLDVGLKLHNAIDQVHGGLGMGEGVGGECLWQYLTPSAEG